MTRREYSGWFRERSSASQITPARVGDVREVRDHLHASAFAWGWTAVIDRYFVYGYRCIAYVIHLPGMKYVGAQIRSESATCIELYTVAHMKKL